jgi:hypothetical protein
MPYAIQADAAGSRESAGARMPFWQPPGDADPAIARYFNLTLRIR